jgi:hypothetical protein
MSINTPNMQEISDYYKPVTATVKTASIVGSPESLPWTALRLLTPYLSAMSAYSRKRSLATALLLWIVDMLAIC